MSDEADAKFRDEERTLKEYAKRAKDPYDLKYPFDDTTSSAASELLIEARELFTTNRHVREIDIPQWGGYEIHPRVLKARSVSGLAEIVQIRKMLQEYEEILAVESIELGESQRSIAKIMGISEASISRYIKNWRKKWPAEKN